MSAGEKKNEGVDTKENTYKSVIDEVEEDLVKYFEERSKLVKIAKFLPYPGGDFYIFDDLNKIFSLAPAKTFVEVFGGSCHSSMNVSRDKFKVIVCNDIDSDLINLYRLVKDNPAEVQKRLSILPFSREIKAIAKDILSDPKADPLTRAVMLFYLIRASMFGIVGAGFAVRKKKKSSAKGFTNAISLIKEYAKQMRDIVFENKDYERMLRLYDSDETLFYLDPPYVSAEETQGREEYYRNVFTVEDLKKMAQALRSIKGYFVLKLTKDNYELIKDILPPHNHVELKRKLSFYKTKGENRPEWTMVIAYNFPFRQE
jgi:DNA adenine methylase